LKALEKSDNFVMEINYTDPNEMASLQKMYQTDHKISDQLSPDEAKELNTLLADYGTSLKNIDSSSPRLFMLFFLQKPFPVLRLNQAVRNGTSSESHKR
jgi:uncharacterized protein YbaP (TraB family)